MPDEDIKVLSDKISRIKPKPRSKVKVHDSCLVVALADWQIGKIATEVAVEEYFKSIYSIKDSLKDLRKKDRKTCIAGMGDLLENTCNFSNHF